MPEKVVLSRDKDVDQKVLASCLKCQIVTNHKVVSSVDKDTSYTEGTYDFFENESFQVIQCQGCNSFSFRHESSNSEDMEQIDENKWGTEIKVRIFPERRRRPPLPDAQYLPYKIQNVYEETYQALNYGQPILAGIGIRALVESVCKNRNASGTLEQMINKLVQSNDLRQAEADILHKLRFMGNVAAHEIKPPSAASLSLAFDIVEHLLVNVYLLERRAQGLPDRT